MQIFLERVVEILQKWAPPRQVTFKCLPPGGILRQGRCKIWSTQKHYRSGGRVNIFLLQDPYFYSSDFQICPLVDFTYDNLDVVEFAKIPNFLDFH